MFSLLAQFDITVFTTQPHKVQSKPQSTQLMEDRQFSSSYAASFGHDNVGPFVFFRNLGEIILQVILLALMSLCPPTMLVKVDSSAS